MEAIELVIAPEIVGAIALYAAANEWAAIIDERRAHDPPSSDFAQVVNPTIPNVSAPHLKGDMARTAWEVVLGYQWALAYRRAWIESYERYQGALAAADQAGMVRQSKAMFDFATKDLEASRTASARWGEFQELLLRELQPQINTGIVWKEVLARYHESGRADAVRDTVRRAMASAGILSDYIARFLEGMSSLTPERAERSFNEWRGQVEFSAVQRKSIRKEISDVGYSRPPDIGMLLNMQQRSADLLEDALRGSGRPNTTGQSVSGAFGSRAEMLEVLRRRASFTRSHRGSFAVPVEGSISDSSASVASFYTDDHVYLAWHQQSDQIVFAAFDAAGKVALEPHVIGKGRWPRMTADGHLVDQIADGIHAVPDVERDGRLGADAIFVTE